MSQTDMGFAPPRKARMPVEPIVRTAEIEGNYRFTATRAWGAGPVIMWTLLNPSVADGTRDDPTMKRMMGFSYRWGFGSMVVTNIYPFISSTTDALWRWRAECIDGDALNQWQRNMDVVREQLAKVDRVVAAWGNGAVPDDLKEFEREIGSDYKSGQFMSRGTIPVRPIDWYCIGTTASGAPIHPLARGKHRVPDTATLQKWSRP